MKKPEAILIRVGEQSLKSDFVRGRFQRVLVHNISFGLDAEKIKYSLKSERNRILIFTKYIDKTEKILKMIFGITSFSPVWISKPTIKDMRKLGAEISPFTKLNKNTSFAVRARRSGAQSFTSQDIGREVGDAINIKTKSPVDLTNPDKEIFVDCREKEAYLYFDRIGGVGGLPLGTAGTIFAYINSENSVAAAWMMMKRGCRLNTIVDNKKYLKYVKKWHIGKSLRIFYLVDIKKIGAIAIDENIDKKMLDMFYKEKMLVLRPLAGLEKDELKKIVEKIEQN